MRNGLYTLEDKNGQVHVGYWYNGILLEAAPWDDPDDSEGEAFHALTVREREQTVDDLRDTGWHRCEDCGDTRELVGLKHAPGTTTLCTACAHDRIYGRSEQTLFSASARSEG